MAATRLTNGLAGRARRRTPFPPGPPVGRGRSGRARRAAPWCSACWRGPPGPRRRPGGHRGPHGGAGDHDLHPRRRRDVGQARHLHPVRQRALHPGQPERAQRPAADAEPAQLHHRQRDADPARAHAADRAHGRRHRDLRDRPYGSDQGGPIANEYNYYTPSGSTDTAGAFAYWTDPIVDYSTTTGGRPATATTRWSPPGQERPGAVGALHPGGLRLGSVAAADTELENTMPDIPMVYGANSPEAREAENPKLANKAGPTSWAVRALRAGLAGLRQGTGCPNCCPPSRAATRGYRRCSATSSSSR